MRILHYSLGFPPYRTGGLTKYCIDLMEEEITLGNEVSLLWPGRMRLFNKKIKIKNEKNKLYPKINSYEIINPLPVPLLEGINNIEEYIKPCDISVFEKFLDDLKPDVVHIHTLMGLHKEFIETVRKKNIKIVYTSHDYFGLCPKVNLFNYENQNCDGINNKKCAKCCENALNTKKIYILQSRAYRKLKDSRIVKKIRASSKEKRNQENANNVKRNDRIEEVDYSKLKKYYMDMFEGIDSFIFNSKTAQEVFERQLNIENGYVIPVMHKDIKDKRTIKKYEGKKLKIGYVGAQSLAKGYNNLKDALDILNKENFDFELNVYFKINAEHPDYIKMHEPYNYNNMDSVYNSIDVLVVPSSWKETFGFIVLEALAHGTPVICSKNVGASYLIEEYNAGIVYKNKNELLDILKELCTSKDKIKEWNMNIIKDKKICMDMKEHTEEIMKKYKE